MVRGRLENGHGILKKPSILRAVGVIRGINQSYLKLEAPPLLFGGKILIKR